MKKQNNQKIELTIEKIYNRFAVFFFSTLFLIWFVLLIGFELNKKNPYFQYAATGAFALFFWGYGYLLGDFIGNYLVRTFNFFKEKYDEYKYLYWIIFAILLIITLIGIGLELLGKEKTIEISITTGLFGALALLSYFLKQWYEKSRKPTMK